MPMANSLWTQEKKKMVLFIGPMLQLQCGKDHLSSTSVSPGTPPINSNGKNRSAGIGMIVDVRGLCKQGRLKEAIHVLYVPDQRGMRLDFYVYASLLQGCIDMKALPEGKLVHAHMIQTGFESDVELGTKLLIMYAKCRRLIDARRVLDQMPQQNVVSWTAMVAAYTRNGYGEEALELYYQMQRRGFQPNQFTFASVLPACANSTALQQGKDVHEDIIRTGFESDVFVGSALVDMYGRCGSVVDAFQVFDKMPERNVVSWNMMIVAYAQNGYAEEALKLFEKTPERNVVSWTGMIVGHAQNGYVDKALKLFEKMPERNVVTWTAMIAGYVQNGHVHEALKLFEKMPERNVVSWTAMIAGYAQNGRVGEAVNLFEKMSERNVVSWNAMIAGYTHNGYFDEALKLFQQMELSGVKPNSVTFAIVLPACGNLAALQQGREVHKDIIRYGFQSDIFVGNALVDMYAKCGLIEDARHVFDKMAERNTVSWNAIIIGYAMHGFGKEALRLFEKMQLSGTKPNHVTFVGVLSACCHAGLVNDGWKYFDRMTEEYHITPVLEHYCCMVDLLGRAGHLNEAQNFINNMPIKPDAGVWGSLLGSCRIHANVELGERVAEHLFELDPENSAHYVMLSNIYAAAGRWDDKVRVRKMMKDKKVNTRPGRSWIEVNNKVHNFLVGDRSHPQTDKIYAELERLHGQIKEAGYEPDVNSVLYDVEEEQKHHILCYHSEKLAIAFGLINTSPGTPIRVVKNLRVCGDCHSAIKFISKIVAREIVVRDANRFHHFKDGWCSCGGYW